MARFGRLGRRLLRRRRRPVPVGIPDMGGPDDLGWGDDGGLAGVREPRRPKPSPPSLTMELELPKGN